MKRFSEQLNTKAKTVKLQAAEKRELRARVVSYMEYHPLPKEIKNQGRAGILSPLQTDPYTMIKVPFAMLAKWSVAAAVLILVIIPVMAENAVPGDGLYAVKVRFNEEVRSNLALTSYEKIEWETERLNRRIAEARLLANEGRLTDEVEAEVVEAVKQQTENVQREIDVLRIDDEDEATMAAIALNTTLEVQSASFREEEAGTQLSGNESQSPKLLANLIDETISRHTAANVSSSIPAYDKLMARVELNTTRAHELLATLNLQTDTEVHKDITRRVEDIGRQVEEAIQVREEDDKLARELLVDSLQRTQRLIVYMAEIEFGQELDVEEIVPVVLTPEEKEEQIKQYRFDVKKQIEIIGETIKINTDSASMEKAEHSLIELNAMEKRINEATEYFEIKKIAVEALALGADTLALFDTESVVDGGTVGTTTDVIKEPEATEAPEDIVEKIIDATSIKKVIPEF